MKVIIWVLMVILYLALCGFLRGVIGMNASYGVVTVALGYGVWLLGRAWTRRISRR